MSHLRTGLSAALLTLTLAACGGGSGSTPPAPSRTVSPTTTPAPSPTIAAQANHIAAGFSGPGKTALAAVRKIKSTSISNAIETVVQSYSANGWGDLFGNLYVWAVNSTTNAVVTETSLTATIAQSGLTVQNTIADSIGFDGITGDWIVAFYTPTATGQYQVAVTFGDGTTGSVPVDVYDQFYVGCGTGAPLANVYTAGAIGPSTNQTTAADVYIDCAGGNLVFPNGAVATAPVTDEYGNVITTIAGIDTPGTIPTAALTVPLSSISVGEVFVAHTAAGGLAKFEPYNINAVGTTGDLEAAGLALSTSTSTFAY